MPARSLFYSCKRSHSAFRLASRAPGKDVNSLFQFLESNQLLLGGSAAAGLGLCFFFWGLRFFLRNRSALSSPNTLVHTATPGLATFVGTAVGPRTLSAPITGNECYIYRTTIWQREPDHKTEWKNVAEETGHLTFFVEDPTGKMSVEPCGAELDLGQSFQEEYASLTSETSLPERIANFMVRNGVTPGRPTRIEECCLLPKNPVFVTGTVTEVAGERCAEQAERNSTPALMHSRNGASPGPASQISPPEVVRLSSGPIPTCTTQMSQQAKIAAALSRAGMAQKDIWASAGADAWPPSENSPRVPSPIGVAEKMHADPGSPHISNVETASDSDPEAANPPSEPTTASRLMVVKGATDSRFLISNCTHDENRAVDWKSIMLVVAGSSLTVLGLWVLLLERHLH